MLAERIYRSGEFRFIGGERRPHAESNGMAGAGADSEVRRIYRGVAGMLRVETRLKVLDVQVRYAVITVRGE
jgi:hypothetical protein